MKKIIITTTINPPTEALIKYTQLPEWHVVVAGDLKTDHKLFENIPNLTYLPPKHQENKYPKLSKLIGWNCVQRRNFAALEALEQGADIIGIIDDDNIPFDDWGEDLCLTSKIKYNHYECNDVAFDPIGATNYKNLWHRGFPIDRVPYRDYTNKSTKESDFDIQAIFWNGDPDVDAIGRMIFNPKCEFDNSSFPLASNKISPFNSQATILKRKVFLDYFLFPFVGRMDDIWASFYTLARGHKVVYTQPKVFSNRDLGTVGRFSVIEDMKKEYGGYENNTEILKQITVDPDNIKHFIPERSWECLIEWKSIVSKIIK